jgi:preprotein translocase subunit SecY
MGKIGKRSLTSISAVIAIVAIAGLMFGAVCGLSRLLIGGGIILVFSVVLALANHITRRRSASERDTVESQRVNDPLDQLFDEPPLTGQR